MKKKTGEIKWNFPEWIWKTKESNGNTRKRKHKAERRKMSFTGDQFPRAFITKYHKLGGLKYQKCFLSQFQKPKVKVKGKELVPSWEFWRKFCSMPVS